MHDSTDSDNLQEICRETAKTLGIPGGWRVGRSSAASSPDCRSGWDRDPPKSQTIRITEWRIRQMWSLTSSGRRAAGTFVRNGSAARRRRTQDEVRGVLRKGRPRLAALAGREPRPRKRGRKPRLAAQAAGQRDRDCADLNMQLCMPHVIARASDCGIMHVST